MLLAFQLPVSYGTCVCGVCLRSRRYGALRRSPSMLRAFYLSNAASALCYLAGVAMLVGVMIPSVVSRCCAWLRMAARHRAACAVTCHSTSLTRPLPTRVVPDARCAQRCACDPLCQQPGNGVAAPGVQLSGLPDEEPLQFHGVDARTETVPDVATALLPAEYDSLCSRVAVAGLYASAVLSIAAAALHAYGFVLGRRLYKASSSPVRSPSAAVLPSSAAAASGPVSAPGPRRHSDARLVRQSPGSGRGLGSGLYQRTAMDVEAASWRAAVASPSVAFSGPASGSSVRSSSGADGLC